MNCDELFALSDDYATQDGRTTTFRGDLVPFFEWTF